MRLAQRAGPRLVLAGLTALALALRLYRLDAAGFWGDESLTQLHSEHVIPYHVLRFQLHGLLFYLVSAAWMALGEELLGAAGDVWCRLPTVLTGVALVPATYWMARRVLGREDADGATEGRSEAIALVAAGLMATSPLLVQLSQEFRFYPLLLLCSIWSMGLLWTIREAPESQRRRAGSPPHCSSAGSPPRCSSAGSPSHWTLRRHWVVFGLASLVGCLCHLFYFLVPLFQGAMLLVSGKRGRRLLPLFLIALLPCVALALYGALFEQPWEEGGKSLGPDIGFRPFQLLRVPLGLFRFVLGLSTYHLDLAYVVPALLAVTALGLLGLTGRTPLRGRRGVLLIWTLGPLLFAYGVLVNLFSGHGLMEKYFLWSLPAIYLIVAAGAFAPALTGAWRGAAVAAVMVVNLIGVQRWYANEHHAYVQNTVEGLREDIREATAPLAPGDLILTDPEHRHVRITMSRYNTGPAPVRRLERDPSAHGGRRALVQRLARQHRRVLVVLYNLPMSGGQWQEANELLTLFRNEFEAQPAFHHYPMQGVLLTRRDAPTPIEITPGKRTWLPLPVQPDRLEFCDLSLPLRFDDLPRPTGLAFMGPQGREAPCELGWELSGEAAPDTVEVLGAMFDAPPYPPDRLDQPVLRVTLTTATGQETTTAFRPRSWMSTDTAAIDWRHRSRLLGGSDYPGALRDFTAALRHDQGRLAPTEAGPERGPPVGGPPGQREPGGTSGGPRRLCVQYLAPRGRYALAGVALSRSR